MWPEVIARARAVAVLDTDAELPHAATLAPINCAEAATAADALTDAHVLAPGRPPRFTHPIIGRAVYEDLPSGGQTTRTTAVAVEFSSRVLPRMQKVP
jgi:hypothetical protein